MINIAAQKVQDLLDRIVRLSIRVVKLRHSQ